MTSLPGAYPSPTTIAMSTSSHLHKRQNLGGYGGYDGRYSDSFWYTNSGYATRYGITAAIILLIFGYFIGGWLHGKARLRKNKPLLAYHRVSTNTWLSHELKASRPETAIRCLECC